MSRPIKFRGWDTVHKTMTMNVQDDYSIGEWAEDSRFVLMQYTGLCDRNGKEIYEGDIIKQTYITQSGNVHDGTDMTYSGHHIGKVVITARGVCLKNPLHYSDDTDETNYMNAYKQVAGYRSEVIGNVWEHPYLLHEGEGAHV